MQATNFEEALEQILVKDARYQREAYLFVREALDFTQKLVTKGKKERVRHVSGRELLNGIKAFALDQFGPMSLTVLQEWGVARCEDFGELVFTMVEHNLLAKTQHDSREDFKGGYDFEEVFHKPFLPTRSSSPSKPKPESRPTEA